MATNAELQNWLQFALQQLAAESYLHGDILADRDETVRRLMFGFNDPTHPYISDLGGAETAILPAANRFTEVQANTFLNRYQIRHHHANDSTGFSATLIFDTATTSYTLSFKSTEYRDEDQAGDWLRDGWGGADGEIVRDGFAFAQLMAMEDYYNELRLSNAIPAGATLNVSGYSLSGQMATLFTLMHAEDVSKTYIFNGAGHGNMLGGANGENVEAMLTRLRDVMTNPQGVPDPTGQLTAQRINAIGMQNIDPLWDPFSEQPDRDTRGNIYDDPRYIYALAIIENEFSPSLTPSSTPISKDPYKKITQIYGQATHDDVTIVANSQRHTSNVERVFIEDLPNSYQGAGIGFLPGDYGNTHSLIGIIDSLTLTDLFQTISPELTSQQVDGIFAASSHLRANGTLFGGSYENESLEKALDALRKIFASAQELASFQPTPIDTAPDGYKNFDRRTQYHINIAALKEKLTSSGTNTYNIARLVGELETDGNENQTLPTATSRVIVATAAKEWVAYRYALNELIPFVVDGVDYSAHNANGELDLYDDATGKGSITEQWIHDRAAMLEYVVDARVNNRTLVQGILSADTGNVVYSAQAGGASVVVHPIAAALFEGRKYVIFDGEESTALLGQLRDGHLYGGGGNDTLDGSLGNDYLEGGEGNDILRGGGDNDVLFGGVDHDELFGDAGRDELWGGAGNDKLNGGKGNDRLDGGLGFDTYEYQEGGRAASQEPNLTWLWDDVDGDGNDTITDPDGLGDIHFTTKEGVTHVLNGGRQVALNTDVWKSVDANGDFDGQFTYQFIADVNDGILLVNGGAISIERFTTGDLGINLVNATAPPPPPPERRVGTDSFDGLFYNFLNTGAVTFEGLGGPDVLQRAKGVRLGILHKVVG